MKILHLLNDEPDKRTLRIISAHEDENEVEVVKLNDSNISYDDIIDMIDKCDRVFSWNNVSN